MATSTITPKADYVVEQGTSGIWKYRKWNSGRCEAWASASSSATNYVSIGGWNGYTFNTTVPAFFLTKDNLFMTCPLAGGTQFCMPSGYAFADNLRLYFVSAGSGAQTIYVNLLLIGTWK